MEYQFIGKFVRPFKIGDSIFYVRGLTVGELLDIAEMGLMQVNRGISFYTGIARVCLMGWEWVVERHAGRAVCDEWGTPIYVPFSHEAIDEHLTDEELMEIGKFAYNTLSVLSDEDAEKYRGFTRFMYYLSEKKNKSRAKFFNCKNCIQQGLNRSKLCGLSEDEIEMYKESDEEEDDSDPTLNTVKSVDYISVAKSKYGASKKRKRPKAAEQEDYAAPATYNLGGYKFPECPVSWIDPYIKLTADKLYYVDKKSEPFFSGGIADQPNRLYEALKVVSSESNKIEMEQMEEASNK